MDFVLELSRQDDKSRENCYELTEAVMSAVLWLTGCFVLVKEDVGDLQEILRNVEDKLSAAETCKTMLNEEVLALRQAYDKLSSDLEVSLIFL